MNTQELVRMHVISNQGLVVEELLRNGLIDEEPIYSAENEIMQWWLITPYLAERLSEQGEIVIEDLGCQWWARQSCGQAIYMDAVMAKICKSFN